LATGLLATCGEGVVVTENAERGACKWPLEYIHNLLEWVWVFLYLTKETIHDHL